MRSNLFRINKGNEYHPEKPSKPPRNPVPHVPEDILRPTEETGYDPPEFPSLEDTPLELLEKVYNGYLNHVVEIRELKDDLGHIKVGVKDLMSWKLRHEALHIDITTRIENRLKTFKKSINEDLKPLIDGINNLNSKVQILEKFIEPKTEDTKIHIEYCTRCKWFDVDYGCLKTNPKEYPECFEEVKQNKSQLEYKNCRDCREYDRCQSKQQFYVASNGLEFKGNCFVKMPADNCFNCIFLNKGNKQCWRLYDGKYYIIRYSYSKPCRKREELDE